MPGALEKLGRWGVWTFLDAMSARSAAECARRIEELGYSALWIPEAVGRDPFAFLGYLAAHTEKLVLATGIANIYARDPMTMRAAHQTLSEVAPARFVLGIGVSHSHLVTGIRGHEYGKPLSSMRSYLDAMEKALYLAVKADAGAPIVLAALRDKMLGLAAERTRGAHPYFVPVAHTRHAREILGEGPWLCPEQMVLAETDAEKARKVARANMEMYLRAPNYQNNLLQLGYDESDLASGGSDRLVDDIVAWGDDASIVARVDAHLEAGADHVCIQPLRADGAPGPDMELLERLAPAARSAEPGG